MTMLMTSDLVFLATGTCLLALAYRRHLRSRFDATHYVWSRGLALLCDHFGGLRFVRDQRGGLDPIPFDPARFDHVKDGDLVWMRSFALPQFMDEALPRIQARFTLVTGDEDWGIPSSFDRAHELLEDPRLILWFAQNFDGTSQHPKLHLLPIGLDFHTLANYPKWDYWQRSPATQEAELRKIIARSKPNRERLLRVHADFHFNMTTHVRWGENRGTIQKRLERNPNVDFLPTFLRRMNLWREKTRYAFIISPHGNGLDCHRTWESLVLGCIVIVKRSPLDPLYEGLPVVIVEDWNEITTDNLNLWHEQHRDAFDRPEVQEKLTNRYWIERIRRMTKERMG